MKVEDPWAQMVQWFYHKPQYLPKGDESPWQNCIKSAAQSATTKGILIATEKTLMVFRNISAWMLASVGTRCAERTARPTCWFRTNERISDLPSLRESDIPARTGSVGIPFLLYRALFIMQLADRIFIIAKGVFISYSPLKLLATTGLTSDFSMKKPAAFAAGFNLSKHSG